MSEFPLHHEKALMYENSHTEQITDSNHRGASQNVPRTVPRKAAGASRPTGWTIGPRSSRRGRTEASGEPCEATR